MKEELRSEDPPSPQQGGLNPIQKIAAKMRKNHKNRNPHFATFALRGCSAEAYSPCLLGSVRPATVKPGQTGSNQFAQNLTETHLAEKATQLL
jgi:hypothetical protein